ncbi:DUF3800 domain-containing protein [Brevibacterium sp. ZH18]|uniref:DUF3800 domain-containing protein n=1 Tax=Brevibacterium sp. ZH18 TaxID=2927784 RepID=UPI001F615E10|nr:DUF3800 domain-containing protein [Brevibacterium sp. ZH18]MCI4012337.1 DUF3800 domain-containing protein [Brevibacterium sp. ZH18]
MYSEDDEEWYQRAYEEELWFHLYGELERVHNPNPNPSPAPPAKPKFIAYIDESGSAGGKADGNQFFALGATIINASSKDAVHDVLELIRKRTGRRSGDLLHFKNLKASKGHRLSAASELQSKLFIHSAVISDKSAHENSASWTHDHTYYWVITLLMERLSWMAELWGGEMEVVLAHKRHMTRAKLKQHETRLRNGRGAAVGNRINWDVFTGPIRISTPQDTEFLQLADMFVSAVGAAVNGEGQSRTINLQYLKALAAQLYRGPRGAASAYGIKVHPSKSCPSWVSQI